MIAFVTRSAATVLAVLVLAACGAGAQATSTASGANAAASGADSQTASVAPSQAATSTPSEAEPSEGGASTACLDADVLAALEAYKDVEVPSEPSMDEVADAFEALDLDGRAAEYRDSLVEALRDDSETLDSMKLQSIMFSLLPLQSEINLVEC